MIFHRNISIFQPTSIDKGPGVTIFQKYPFEHKSLQNDFLDAWYAVLKLMHFYIENYICKSTKNGVWGTQF